MHFEIIYLQIFSRTNQTKLGMKYHSGGPPGKVPRITGYKQKQRPAASIKRKKRQAKSMYVIRELNALESCLFPGTKTKTFNSQRSTEGMCILYKKNYVFDSHSPWVQTVQLSY